MCSRPLEGGVRYQISKFQNRNIPQKGTKYRIFKSQYRNIAASLRVSKYRNLRGLISRFLSPISKYRIFKIKISPVKKPISGIPIYPFQGHISEWMDVYLPPPFPLHMLPDTNKVHILGCRSPFHYTQESQTLIVTGEMKMAVIAALLLVLPALINGK